MTDASKLFVVRKFVKATSVADALRKEKKTPVDEIFIDDDWRKNEIDNLSRGLGFNQTPPKKKK